MRGTGVPIAAVLVMCARVAAADGDTDGEPADEPDGEPAGEAEGEGLADLIDDASSSTATIVIDPEAAPTDDTESEPRTPIAWTDLITTDCPPRRHADRELHLEMSVGGLGGIYRVGPVRGAVFALRATAGIRRERWAVLADYALMSFNETPDGDARGRTARIHRGGVLARYSLLSGSETYPTSHADLWLEAGVGRELLRWYDGGRLARNDVRIGFGGQGALWFDHDRHEFGAWITLAAVIAPAPAAKQTAPSCAGPCDAPTGTDPYDVMFWLDVGFPFR